MSPKNETSSTLPVLISGYYGFDNLGDEAILESILQWFDKRDDVHPVVLSNDPMATFDAYGVDSIRRTSLWQILKRIGGAPVILQGGGGLLQDKTSTKSLMYYLGIMLLGFVTGRRVVAFGQGIGPLDGEFSPLLVGEFLSQCDLVCVRDFKSYSFCQQRLPITANIKLMADAALLLNPADSEIVEDIFLQENIDLVGKPLVAFCVRGSRRDQVQINAIARAIDMTTSNLGGGVILIPFHLLGDFEYAEIIRKHVNDKDSVVVLKGKYRPAEMLGLIGKCDLVVGMRLHSLIFAANMGVPFVAMSYDPKIDEFAGEFGIKPAVHTPLVGPEMLFDAIADTYEQRGRIKTRITDTSKRLRDRAQSGFDALGEF
ncbi:MAG: polysaccharide pyruvyl transferase CsaB, partial [bacterium]|nr:polysaccharide pyruvyl transferase CsaB [bacterium]